MRSRKLTVSVVILVLIFISVIPHFQNDESSSFSRSLATEEEEDDDEANLHFWKYAYVIVTYHKSGHELSHVLRGYLDHQFKGFGGKLRRNMVSPRENFNPLTKCSELSFGPGTITIIEAPEFHCTGGELANILMNNPNPKKTKWGIKIIHLVRNPFSMAVSNYHYHSQDPTPEPYVHWKNPCLLYNVHTGPVADLVAPLLSNPTMGIQEVYNSTSALPARMPIMTHGDFTNIIDDCNSLYQTEHDLGNATYYEHLRALPPEIGLRMATADKFSHIALMASDMIMFDRVRQLEWERTANRPWRRQRRLSIITMPMEEWIDHPDESMYKFLEFVFQDHIPKRMKENVSGRYGKAFFKKRVESQHITTGKYANTAELVEYLRRDAVYGGPLARIEALLDDVLHLQSIQ